MYIYQITYILCQLYFSKLDENFQEENLHIVLHSLCTFNIIIDMPGLNLLSCYYYIILETQNKELSVIRVFWVLKSLSYLSEL